MSYFGLPEGIEYYIMNSDELKQKLYDSAVVYIDNGFDIETVIEGIYCTNEYEQMTESDKDKLIFDVIYYANKEI